MPLSGSQRLRKRAAGTLPLPWPQPAQRQAAQRTAARAVWAVALHPVFSPAMDAHTHQNRCSTCTAHCSRIAPAGRARPGRAPRAVQVVHGAAGEVKVDDVVDRGLHVQTPAACTASDHSQSDVGVSDWPPLLSRMELGGRRSATTRPPPRVQCMQFRWSTGLRGTLRFDDVVHRGSHVQATAACTASDCWCAVVLPTNQGGCRRGECAAALVQLPRIQVETGGASL